jgi:hypothetical protein
MKRIAVTTIRTVKNLGENKPSSMSALIKKSVPFSARVLIAIAGRLKDDERPCKLIALTCA